MIQSKLPTAIASAASAAVAIAATVALVGCPAATTPTPAGSTAAKTVVGYQVEAIGASTLTANAGDTVKFCGTAASGCQAVVVETMSDGSTASLPTGAVLDYSTNFPTVIARKGYETSGLSNLPGLEAYATNQAAGVFAEDPIGARADGLGLHGALFVMHKGSGSTAQIPVHIAVSGITPGGEADTAVTVASGWPAGNVSNGASVFRNTTGHSANCAECHGINGEGSPSGADANGNWWLPWTNTTTPPATSDNAAPALNFTGYAGPTAGGSDGNVAANFKNWSPAVLAFATRADIDNTGAWLEEPMPQWLTYPANDGKALTAQDFADIWAFLAQNTATPSAGTATSSIQTDTAVQP